MLTGDACNLKSYTICLKSCSSQAIMLLQVWSAAPAVELQKKVMRSISHVTALSAEVMPWAGCRCAALAMELERKTT